MKNIYIFSIEGNIGSGKSTVIKQMKKKFNTLNNCDIIYLPEPVDVWSSIKDEKGKNIIEKFYADNKKYAFSFQIMAYISRISQIRKLKKSINPEKTYILITERSVHTDKNVFAKMLYENKDMGSCEHQIYNKWFNEFIEDVPNHKYIYIDTDPNKCLERINKRSRKGEKIPVKYLNLCKKYHDTWLNNVSSELLTLNGDIEINTPEYNEFINIIVNFISEHTPISNFSPPLSPSIITMEMVMNHPFF
jgi:deoxyguanosine kinase